VGIFHLATKEPRCACRLTAIKLVASALLAIVVETDYFLLFSS
jgi:hypothetical protein